MAAFCFQKLWDIAFDRIFSSAQFENGKKVWVTIPEALKPVSYDINIEGLTLQTLNFFKNLLATERIKNVSTSKIWTNLGFTQNNSSSNGCDWFDCSHFTLL